MWEIIKQYQNIILGGLILVGLAIYAVINPATVSYQAAPNTDQVATGSATYDEVFSDYGIGRRLHEANRQGGIDLLGKRYVAEDYALCLEIDFTCDEGEEYFFDPYGCGCKKLDFDDGASDASDGEGTKEEDGVVYAVSYGEPMRLRYEDTIELSNGDLLWIETLAAVGTDTRAVFSVYSSVDDTTYSHPGQASLIPYTIETIGGDFNTFVDLVITRLGEIDDAVVDVDSSGTSTVSEEGATTSLSGGE